MKSKELNVECVLNEDIEKYKKTGVNIDNLNSFSLKIIRNDLTILVFMNPNKRRMKKYVKKLLKYKRFLYNNFEKIKFVLIDFDEENHIHTQFKELLIPILSCDKDLLYNKAYDLACDYLDSFFYGKNLCDFCNNKCGYRPNFKLDCGCCRHFEKHKQFGLLFGEKLVPCEKLGDDGHCTIKCMRCKLFSCEYLNKKGVNFNTGKIFCLYSIFNPIQRLILNMIAYTDKPDVLKIVKIF